MTRLPLLVTIVSLGLIAASHAQQIWDGGGRIQFRGKSTLHAFAGSVKAQPFILTISQPGNPETATVSAQLAVKAEEMDTDKKKRDLQMRESLDAAAHPVIGVSLENLKLSQTGARWESGLPRPDTIPFTLSLLGKEQKLTARVISWIPTTEKIEFTVTFPVSLSASGIVVPPVLGVIRVDDTIQVQAEMTLTPGS